MWFSDEWSLQRVPVVCFVDFYFFVFVFEMNVETCLMMNNRLNEEDERQLLNSECVDDFPGLSSGGFSMAEVVDELPSTDDGFSGCCSSSSWNGFGGHDGGHEPPSQNGSGGGVDHDDEDDGDSGGIGATFNIPTTDIRNTDNNIITVADEKDGDGTGNVCSSVAASWILKAKKEFHSRRFLRVANLPMDATEEVRNCKIFFLMLTEIGRSFCSLFVFFFLLSSLGTHSTMVILGLMDTDVRPMSRQAPKSSLTSLFPDSCS